MLKDELCYVDRVICLYHFLNMFFFLYRSGSSMHPGLSVSHDSVFHSPNSGSDLEIDAAHSSSSLSISHPQIDVRLQVSYLSLYTDINVYPDLLQII